MKMPQAGSVRDLSFAHAARWLLTASAICRYAARIPSTLARALGAQKKMVTVTTRTHDCKASALMDALAATTTHAHAANGPDR
jgi:hypothetical protein